jgi:hypothetical protein
VGPRAVLDAVVKRKIPSPRRNNVHMIRTEMITIVLLLLVVVMVRCTMKTAVDSLFLTTFIQRQNVLIFAAGYSETVMTLSSYRNSKVLL